MSARAAIEGVGRVREIVKAGLCRVEMSNGHIITAFLGKRQANLVDTLTKGVQVAVFLSPFDMSRGRILRILEDNNESKTVS